MEIQSFFLILFYFNLKTDVNGFYKNLADQ
jgi:hypothetical protein